MSKFIKSICNARLWLFYGSLVLTLLVGCWLGAASLVVSDAHPYNLYFARSFDVYDRVPFWRHGFLAFGGPTDFQEGRAYGHLSQFYLIFHYFLSSIVRFVTGAPHSATQFMSLLALIAWLAIIAREAAFGARKEAASEFQARWWVALTVTVPTIVLFTDHPLWIGFLGFACHNCYALGMLPFLWLALRDAQGDVTRRTAFMLLMSSVLICPIYTPVAVLLTAVSYSEKRWPLTRDALVLGFTGVLVFLLPELTALVLRFETYGSGFMFRSGLDGDRRYFTSMLQAVFSPFRPELNRTWRPLVLPSAALVAIAWQKLDGRNAEVERLCRLFITSLLPYVSLVLIFPQMVSIHPYFFDVCLTLPSAWTLFVWSQLSLPVEQLRQGRILFWILLLLFCLASNLHELSAALRIS